MKLKPFDLSDLPIELNETDEAEHVTNRAKQLGRLGCSPAYITKAKRRIRARLDWDPRPNEGGYSDPRPDPRTHPQYWGE